MIERPDPVTASKLVTTVFSFPYDDFENLNINFYRIVQESLNNAVKHAKASKIAVSLKQDKVGNLNLTIQDNGLGMDVNNVDQSQHFGLLGMRERTQAFHGQFNIESSPKKGTIISIYIPKESIA